MSVTVPTGSKASAAHATTSSALTSTRAQLLARITPLLLTLIAFAHVMFGLGHKALWWDESLSLQRAEESLLNLILGVLYIKDGFTANPTIDQHPFFSFLLQAGVIRLVGTSEFALRLVSATAVTAIVPLLYTFARTLVRREVVPASAPWIVALLAALSPFFLWYGQEARPYALWAFLALLSTWLLMRALEGGPRPWPARIAYLVILFAFLTTHFYAVFLLPVQALLLVTTLWNRRRALSILLAFALLLCGAGIALLALWSVIAQSGGGNFPSISLGILLPDLVNAFTLGLSVDITTVRWLDAIFAILAIVGAAWMMRSRRTLAAGGWIAPASVVTPVLVLLVGNFFQNLYMNARHMSLISGFLLLLIACGVALLWSRWRWLGGALLVLILGGFAFSTLNYYTQEAYAKDDYRRFGDYLERRIVPGDAVLYYPASSWRIFEYYAPMDGVRQAIDGGAEISIHGVPLLDPAMSTDDFLAELGQDARRIWVLKSGTHPFYDLDWKVEQWMKENFVQVRDAQFFSQSSLRAQLYLPQVPVIEGTPSDLPDATDVVFGDNVRLAGFRLEPQVAPLPAPLSLYWQVAEKPDRRNKYIVELLREDESGMTTLGKLEREPWEGDIPTTFWDPNRTIVEYAELSHDPVAEGDTLWLAIQLYDAETQEKLPVKDAPGVIIDSDGFRALLPLQVSPPVTLPQPEGM